MVLTSSARSNDPRRFWNYRWPATPHTYQNSDQKLWGGTHSHFLKFSRCFRSEARLRESLLQRVLLWSGPSPITYTPHQLPRGSPPERAPPWRSVQPACCGCLGWSSPGYLRGSLLFSVRFLPCRTLLQSSYHRATCSFPPTRAEAPWGQALAVIPWRFLGI